MKKRLLALTIFSFLAGSHQVLAATALTPQHIQNCIQKYGVKQTVKTLYDTKKWSYVEDQMSSGQGKWIALAPKLAAGIDGETSESLGLSLAFSLPKNPQAVLSVLGAGLISAERVCGMPFLEETVKDRPAYKQQALAAVQGVHGQTYAAQKKACLATLEASH